MSTIIQVRPRPFVKTAALGQLMRRALRYLKSGYSIHLEGATGIGKTTVAMQLAHCRQRPVQLLMGHHALTVSNHPNDWFRRACCEGWTLIYDEFNRARPEVNTVLLATLEERVLITEEQGAAYAPIHPEFRMVFTSNSEEYCGTYSPQGALLDRLVTMRLPAPNVLAQQQLMIELVGISREAAALIIDVVQQFFRQVYPEGMASLRPKLMIAEICHQEGIAVSAADGEFRQVCRDILLARSAQSATDANGVLWELFNRLSRQQPTQRPYAGTSIS